jgi:protein O-GlcNAc transferase
MNQKNTAPTRQAKPSPAEMKALIALYEHKHFAVVENQARGLIGRFPNEALLWKLLGAALQAQGKDALSTMQNAAKLSPNDAELHNSLGMLLHERGEFESSLQSYRTALQIDSGFVEAYYNLGNLLSELGRYEAAVIRYRSALKLDPNNAVIHSNLGAALEELGRIDQAVASCRRALELDPGMTTVRSNLLGMLNSTSGKDPAKILEEARKYGTLVSRKVTSRYTGWKCEEPPQRLRVGIVSGDLHNHPGGYFLESLLMNLDQARIELIAYPTDTHSDALTERIKPFLAAWKPLHKLSDADAARFIHADGVHVLLDLAGHTEQNRLPVFAWKPAPVQATWLGYFATTGLVEMDYLLADEVGVPEAQRKYFTETVWYLPDTRLCFTVPEFDLPVASLPALKNGYITFGCFQRLTKVSNEVLKVWGKILDAVPGAMLRWQCRQLGDPTVAEAFAERLRQNGIDPARVTMHGAVSREAYLDAHAEVDVILDTFPFTGGTTTCEALWMGVPTLTLAGDTLLARQGASMLTAAGLPEWIANSEAEYIGKATSLTGDLPGLAKLRAGLREQVKASPLFDAKRFARNFEDALWGMWQAHTPSNSSATEKVV